jgi:hypothetical protein
MMSNEVGGCIVGKRGVFVYDWRTDEMRLQLWRKNATRRMAQGRRAAVKAWSNRHLQRDGMEH